MEDINKAKDFAINAHKDQKYGNYPYFKHLEDVVNVLEDFGAFSPKMICAAFLHDILEDTAITLEELEKNFSKEIVDLVFCVTDEKGKNRKERKLKTYPKIRSNPEAIVLKLADRIANVEESFLNNVSLFKMYQKEHSLFKESIKGDDNLAVIEMMWKYLDSFIEKSIKNKE